MNEIDVEGVAGFSQLEVLAICAVNIPLQLYVRAVAYLALPGRQDIPSGNVVLAVFDVFCRRRKGRNQNALPADAAVHISLQGKLVLVVTLPVRTKPDLP